MIVLRDKPGQFGNRIWSASFFVSFSKKFGVKTIAPFHFNEYRQIFSQKSGADSFFYTISKYFWLNNLFVFLLHHTELFLRKFKFLSNRIGFVWFEDGMLPQDILTITKKKVVFINSFKFLLENMGENIILDKNYVRAFFKIDNSIENKIGRIIRSKVSENEILVGVHIRKNDYKTYRNGIYYFSNETYVEKMRQIKSECLVNKTPLKFLICSDEKIDHSYFEEFNYLKIEDSTLADDLTALSHCNYIMGPPSTFSQWASFYRDIPLMIIKEKHQRISLKEFSPIVYIHAFENGERFVHITDK